MLAGNVVVKLLALFVSIYLARYLGVEYFGEYNFILTYLTFFNFIANFGLDPVLIRDISRHKIDIDHLTSNIFIIRILTSLFSICLAVMLIWYFDYPKTTIRYVFVLSVILLFQGISYLFESVFNAKLKMHYSAIGLIVSKLFYSVSVFILIYLNRSLLDFFYLYILAEILRLAIAFYYSFNFVTIKLSVDLKLWKYLLKECIPFIVSYAFFIIYYRIDILMLSKMEGSFAVGIYSSAFKIIDPLLFIPSALTSTLVPLMSKAFINDLPKLKHLYSEGTKYIVLLMLPLTIALFILSENVIHLLYTEEYYVSIVTFQILSLTLFFNSVNSMQNSLLIASDRQKVNTLSLGFCCVLNVLLNYMFIPSYGCNGAAFATLLSVITLFTLQFLFIKRSLSIIAFSKSNYPIVLASILTGAFVYVFQGVYILFLMLACPFVYLFFLYITKSISDADISLLKQIIGKKL